MLQKTQTDPSVLIIVILTISFPYNKNCQQSLAK